MKLRHVLLLLFLTSAILAIALKASAQNSPPKPQGITVSPGYQQISMTASETEHKFTLKITNNRPTAQTIAITSADFNALEDTGGLYFIGANPTQLEKKYGLANWIDIPEKMVTIPPGETAAIDASIVNLPSLASGGHYGAIFLNFETSGSTGGKNKIALTPVASSLLFLNKVGGDIHKLSLQQVSYKHSLFKLPKQVTLRFQNAGNTHLVPRGIVTITNKSDKVVAKGIINENSQIILPEKKRDFVINLENSSLANSPGHYSLRVDYRFDGLNNFRSYQTSFLLLTPVGIFGLLIFLIIVASLAFLAVKKWPKIKLKFGL
jgi:hypothetical protein